jgi:hypothetical protein
LKISENRICLDCCPRYGGTLLGRRQAASRLLLSFSSPRGHATGALVVNILDFILPKTELSAEPLRMEQGIQIRERYYLFQ